jgi:hypothetical protein
MDTASRDGVSAEHLGPAVWGTAAVRLAPPAATCAAQFPAGPALIHTRAAAAAFVAGAKDGENR